MSGFVGTKRNTVSCGRDLDCVVDLQHELHSAFSVGFDFVCVPIVHPRYEREMILPAGRSSPLTRSDLTLASSEWTSVVVGKLSPWLNLDSDVAHIRKKSEKAFFQEFSLALHLGLPAILVSVTSEYMNLARCLNELTSCQSLTQVWVKVPINDPQIECSLATKVSSTEEEGTKGATTGTDGFQDTWHWWNTVQTLCCYSSKVGLALEVPHVLPAQPVLNRWLGEPLKVIFLSTSIFLVNQQGFPVLSKAHQAFVCQVLQLGAQLVLVGRSRVDKDLKTHRQYLKHLHQTMLTPHPIVAVVKSFEDHFLAPLQPLMNNLGSHIYEMFEEDKTKYTMYEEAVFRALLDRVPEEDKATRVTVLMVVGAGRGPIVRASLRASQRSGRQIRVYAVEKNPNAVITLRNFLTEEWSACDITIVHHDMRDWDAPEKADILVSELLGAFGDNELSPECLDGAQKFLKEDGISIPSSYTSYVIPTSSAHLYADLSCSLEQGKNHGSPYETGYVVYQRNHNQLAEPQPCFTFCHPNHSQPIDNERFARLSFAVSLDCVMHGFSGFFKTTLYKDVTLSIVPATHTPNLNVDLFSWLSIFFPLKTPLFVPSGSTVEICLWRKVNRTKVWYEWCVTKPTITPIQNPGGRSYWLGLH